jgi:hypothetical protein
MINFTFIFTYLLCNNQTNIVKFMHFINWSLRWVYPIFTTFYPIFNPASAWLIVGSLNFYYIHTFLSSFKMVFLINNVCFCYYELIWEWPFWSHVTLLINILKRNYKEPISHQVTWSCRQETHVRANQSGCNIKVLKTVPSAD